MKNQDVGLYIAMPYDHGRSELWQENNYFIREGSLIDSPANMNTPLPR